MSHCSTANLWMLWRLCNPKLAFEEYRARFMLDSMQNKTGPWATHVQMVNVLGWSISFSSCACFPIHLEFAIRSETFRWSFSWRITRHLTGAPETSAGLVPIVLWKEACPGSHSQGTCARVCFPSCWGFSRGSLALSLSSPWFSFLLENVVGKKDTTGEIARISSMERTYNNLEVQHIHVHGQVTLALWGLVFFLLLFFFFLCSQFPEDFVWIKWADELESVHL